MGLEVGQVLEPLEIEKGKASSATFSSAALGLLFLDFPK